MDPKLAALSFRDLEYLVALARERHFRRAAEECFISQPTLSAQIKKIEEVLDVRIFDRSRKQVRVTSAGQAIVDQAHRVLEEAAKITRIATKRKILSGPLTLGVVATLGPYLLPLVLPGLREHFPELSLFILEGKTSELAEAIRRGKADLIIGSPSPLLDGLEEYPLFFEPFMVCLPVTEPLAQATHLQRQDLQHLPMLVLEEGHCLADQAYGFCARPGFNPVRLQAASLETLRQMVAAGHGTALFPQLAVNQPHPMNKLICYLPFDDPTIGREICLYCRADSSFQEDAAQLKAFFHEQLPALQ